MTITSGIFNSVNGDRKYNAQFFAQYFASFVGNGIFADPTSSLQVVSRQNMQTTVKAGKGWINGYYINNDSDYVLQHDVSDGILKRIDRIVMRLNYLTRQIEIVIKKGANASTPIATPLQRDSDYVELALADVYINNGVTSITQANITDRRFDSSLCGVVKGLIDEIDTTGLFSQYETEFRTWFSNLQSALEGNVATNLQTQINNKLDLTGTAVKAKQLETVRTIDGVNFDGTGNIVHYTTSSTATATAAKVATLATFNLVAGARITVKFTNANTATAPTLNISSKGAKALKKHDGTNFTNIKAGGVYTFVYDGTAFFVQGEGGEYGTATPSQVLTGYTFGGEDGLRNGTMVNHGSPTIHVTAMSGTSIPSGYYTGANLTVPVIAGNNMIYEDLRYRGAGSGEDWIYTYQTVKGFRVNISGTYRLFYNLSHNNTSTYAQPIYAAIFRGNDMHGGYVQTTLAGQGGGYGPGYLNFSFDLYFEGGVDYYLKAKPESGSYLVVSNSTLRLSVGTPTPAVQQIY